MHRAAEADIGEQLDEIGAADGSLVDEVLPLPTPHEAARDRDLAEVDLVAEAAVRVVEDELDLAVVGGLPVHGAAEEDIVGLLGAQLGRRQRAGRPDDRVGHVRLAGAVRANDHGHAWLELELDRVDERLEAADLDRLEMHVGRTLTAATDVAGMRSGTAISLPSLHRLESLPRGLLLGRLLRRGRADPDPLARDHGDADERRSCGGPSTSDHLVLDLVARPRERLLQLGLVVDGAGAGELDSRIERLDDRRSAVISKPCSR